MLGRMVELQKLWDDALVDAAKTKPYGFQAFYPGPGLGGHCIPLDPYYLSWKAREYGFHTSMIESSMMINDRMPEYCVDRAARILNQDRKALNGAKVLVLGVAYKQDIDDDRESPALKVIECFEKVGAETEYYDPFIPSYRYKGVERRGLERLDAEILKSFDLTVITTAHTAIDYEVVAQNSRWVFDTKNAMKAIVDRKNIILL